MPTARSEMSVVVLVSRLARLFFLTAFRLFFWVVFQVGVLIQAVKSLPDAAQEANLFTEIPTSVTQEDM
jgi:hypothetical protein